MQCAFSQARLARQLKEAMAERQMAKSESKALHNQLDKLQKQVFARQIVCFLCSTFAVGAPHELHMTVRHCRMAWFSRGLSIVVVKQLTAGMASGY